MNKPSRVVILSLTLWLTLIGLDQVAYARNYHVELIVFERVEAEKSPSEIWVFSSGRIAAKAQEMRILASQAASMKTNPALNNLAAVRKNLSTSGYRILHSAQWIQPGKVYQNAPVTSFGTPGTSLPFGFVRIYRTSLIFADVSVQLSPITSKPIAETVTVVNTEAGINSRNMNTGFQQPQYFISEKRRLKFKEIHYIDHPRFGVILGVWPVGES